MFPLQPFHLAIPVNSLEEARKFYGEFLGFEEGRSTPSWVDWDFFGHQLVTHLKPTADRNPEIINDVDDRGVPVPHFGVILEWQQWHAFAERLQDHNVKFVIDPYVRFRGETGEQATMFFKDTCGNSLEFKSFKDMSQIFARYDEEE